MTKYRAIAKAGQHLLRTDIPQELLPALVELALKVKSATVSNVTLDASKLRLKYLHPDYGALRDTVEKALEADPAPAVTPTTPPTPSKSARRPVAPPPTPAGPTQNLVDACAYQPNGDQPN